jgi:hypothetical protein
MRFPGAFAVAILIPALAGCMSSGTVAPKDVPVTPGAGVREDTRMTQSTLDQLCYAFGERYLVAVGNGCNQVEKTVKDLEPKARAHSFKLNAASSVYDIVTGTNPFAKLMDLILLVELEYRVWVTDGVAVRWFGAEAGPLLAATLKEGRDDVWQVADKVLKPEERKVLEEMIDDWRAKNPKAESIAFVRFSNFADYRGKSILDNVPMGSGLLAPVSEATRQIEETRMLAERGMFLSKRMPLLVRWHAESLLNTVLLHPELQKAIESANRAVAVAESLPSKVSEERTIILKALEEREKPLAGIVKDVKATAADVKDIVKDTQALLKESEEVIKAADGLVTKLSPPGSSKDTHPFDIREYAQTMKEGILAVHEMRELLESSAWATRVSEVNQAAQARVTHASGEAHRLVESIFWRIAALIILSFVLASGYRIIVRKTAPAR